MNARKFGLIVLAMMGFASTGCASARLCRGITSRADEVKFLYYEGGDTGVIKCRLVEGGSLADCHPMKVALED